jgi:WhiB family redox-sensing transcriptional regulator
MSRCGVCGLVVDDVDRHERRMHPEAAACELCGRPFRSRRSVTVHLAVVHGIRSDRAAYFDRRARPVLNRPTVPVAVLPPAGWDDHAACDGMDPDVFFPVVPRGGGGLYAEARAVCETCPCRADCLNMALALETGERHGMWGGMSPNERDTEAARRRKGVA